MDLMVVWSLSYGSLISFLWLTGARSCFSANIMSVMTRSSLNTALNGGSLGPGCDYISQLSKKQTKKKTKKMKLSITILKKIIKILGKSKNRSTCWYCLVSEFMTDLYL
jgi:hypothetical protein